MAAERLASTGIAMTAALLLAGCMSSHSPALVDPSGESLTTGSVASGSSDQNAVLDSEPAFLSKPDTSKAHRRQVGADYAQQILKRSKVSADKKMQLKLQVLVDELAGHVDGDKFDYQIYLLDDPRPNAFTTGGGHLFVTTGLIATLRSEGQVAAVIAHEMAHNASAHVVKGAHSRKIVKQTAAFSENVMHQRWGVPWLGNSLEFLVSTSVNKYTRQQEDDADFLGLQYIVAAGYDPHEAPRAVEALVAGGGEQSEIHNFFFGRHSTAKSRIWRFGNLIKAYYPTLNTQAMRRSSADYNALAQPYWNAGTTETAAAQ